MQNLEHYQKLGNDKICQKTRHNFKGLLKAVPSTSAHSTQEANKGRWVVMTEIRCLAIMGLYPIEA